MNKKTPPPQRELQMILDYLWENREPEFPFNHKPVFLRAKPGKGYLASDITGNIDIYKADREINPGDLPMQAIRLECAVVWPN